MLTSTLRTVGGSVMMTIPKSLLEALDLRANSKVDLSIDQGHIVIAPRRRPKYTMEELLAQCDPTAEGDAYDVEWDRMEPVGREIF